VSICQLHVDVDAAARSDAKVLVLGESGVGKEVVAQLIHHESRRRRSPLVTINCAGVPDTLLESEMFGHVRGSFTDAHRDKAGRLEVAHGGTVVMDEVGEMSARMQALLVRFLETGEIQSALSPLRTIGQAVEPSAPARAFVSGSKPGARRIGVA
jgi:anaerobic nitric oxide reductase transcription regulator